MLPCDWLSSLKTEADANFGGFRRYLERDPRYGDFGDEPNEALKGIYSIFLGSCVAVFLNCFFKGSLHEAVTWLADASRYEVLVMFRNKSDWNIAYHVYKIYRYFCWNELCQNGGATAKGFGTAIKFYLSASFKFKCKKIGVWTKLFRSFPHFEMLFIQGEHFKSATSMRRFIS